MANMARFIYIRADAARGASERAPYRRCAGRKPHPFYHNNAGCDDIIKIINRSAGEGGSRVPLADPIDFRLISHRQNNKMHIELRL